MVKDQRSIFVFNFIVIKELKSNCMVKFHLF